MPVCPHCGHDNAESDARFCASCGLALAGGPGESPAEATSVFHRVGETDAGAGADGPELSAEAALVERLQPGTALLVVRRGPAAGARFLLDAEVTTAGRHPDSDIFLDDITVSRRHAEFRRGPEGFALHDLGSLNGTYVNQHRVDDAALTSGDEVQIGKFRMLFLSGGAS